MTPITSEADRIALQSQIREKIREGRTKRKIKAPEFPADADWLNTNRRLSLAELRGRVVLLDFWTYCCINCMHVLPDLKYLEEKYAGQPLVVIGVHAAKFTNEKATTNVRQAVLRLGIEHPVVMDSDFAIWQSYTVRAWPTLVMIDPEGYLLGIFSGEGNREILDNYVEVVLDIFDTEGKLDSTPLDLEREQPDLPESLLSYPGKIIADSSNRRLVLADTNHNRLLVCALDGTVQEIVGSGLPGGDDGDFETARFFHPQGMAFHGQDLIVCDTDGHLLRRVDFGSRSVTTIAGTGRQGRYSQHGGAGLKTALNSPWDIFIHGNTGYLAMAGPHQIWTVDLKTHRVEPFAGSGHEARRDGERLGAAFAQPSGITGEVIDGELIRLFVADSEISSLRQIDLRNHKVETLVGGDLFQFGDRDGAGDQVRLQHPLGITFYGGKLYLADTYNHKLKIIDPNLRTCKTWLGDGNAGHVNGQTPRFFEPSGLTVLAGALYVADTNNHAVRVIDVERQSVTTLRLKPKALPATDHLVAMGTPVTRTATHLLAPGAAEIQVKISLPDAYGFNEGSPMQILSQSLNQAVAIASPSQILETPRYEITMPVQVFSGPTESAIRIELIYYYCDKSSALCMMRQAVYEIPVQIQTTGRSRIQIIDSPPRSDAIN